MPSAEDDLHPSFAKSAPISAVEDEVEPSLLVDLKKEKAENGKKGKKDKGKATATEAPSINNVTTRFATKVAVEASATPDVTEVGSPFVGPLTLVESPSYN